MKKFDINLESHASYKEPLLNYFKEEHDLSEITIKQLLKKTRLEEYSKNTTILENGEIENKVRFIIKGIIMCDYHHNDTSYVFDFRSKNQPCCESVSLLDQQPSNISYKTVSDCVVLSIDAKYFYKILKSKADFKQMVLESVNKSLETKHKKESHIRTLSAEERYAQFANDYPEIADSIKLVYIASYLNIAQPSLSRIRKKQKEEAPAMAIV